MPSPSRLSQISPNVSRPWYVYLLRCADGSLYAGITTDLDRRLAAHNAGKGSAYVRAHRPAEVLACTLTEDRSAASRLEREVKALNRADKLALEKTWNTARRKRVD